MKNCLKQFKMKKGHQGRALPSLFDESKFSPRQFNNQMSTDLGSNKAGGQPAKKGLDFIGYESEGMAANDNFRFNSTYEEGFNKMFDSVDRAQSSNPRKLNADLRSQGQRRMRVKK